MNHKQLLALLLSLVILFSPVIVSVEKENIVNVKAVDNSVDEYIIESIIQNEENLSINIYYPKTKNVKVNGIIEDKINEQIEKIKSTDSFNSDKELNISFESFKSQNYISLKFNMDSSVGITHNTKEVFTVVYDENEVIDIDKLCENNPNLINELYEICKESLISNDKFKKYSNEEWLEKGLLKNKSTFSNFIFSENNLIVIFNPYVVAPYVAGIFEVEISCELI